MPPLQPACLRPVPLLQAAVAGVAAGVAALSFAVVPAAQAAQEALVLAEVSDNRSTERAGHPHMAGQRAKAALRSLMHFSMQTWHQCCAAMH